MITYKIRKTLVILLAATAVNLTMPIASEANNPACELNTDFTETVNGDSVTVRFINTARICDWTVPSWLTRASIAIVGGGGSGGYGNQGGGGGGGEVLFASRVSISPSSKITITIGSGGAAAMSSCTAGNTSNCPGKNGGNSSISIGTDVFIARGGGGGGGSTPQAQDISRGKQNGITGGSSGGGNRFGVSVAPTASSYSGWVSYVNTGGRGAGNTTSNIAPVFGGGGGGGGAGSAGTSTISPDSTSPQIPGVGGNAIFLLGMCLGGGGSSFTVSGAQGDRPGCTGVETATNNSGGSAGVSGEPNTGGGSGGSVLQTTSTTAPVGGSGVVLIQYSTVLPTQQITFEPITNKTFATPTFSAPATTDAMGETVTVRSSNTSICTYSGETVTLVSIGTCTLTASQAGSTRFQPATSVVRTFAVTKGIPTMGSFTSLTKTYGDIPFTLDTVTASVPGSFTFSSLDTRTVTINSRTATLVNSGTATIRLVFTPTDSARWESATVQGTITVNKKALTITAPSLTTEFGSARSSFSASLLPSYSGFITGETQSALNVLPTCSESPLYTSSTSPLSSPLMITCSGAVAENYSFTYLSGSLTVSRNDMSEYTDAQLISADRASIVYGDVVTIAQPPVGQFTGVFSGACTQLSALTARATTAAGTCTATFTQNNSNYESRTVVLNIPTLQRQLTVSGTTIADRRFDGTTTPGAVSVGTLGNLYGSQTLLLNATASSYASASAGSGKSSIVTYSISNGTGLASNYLPPVSETLTGNVLKGLPTFGSWSTITITISASGETFTAPTIISPQSGGSFLYSIGNSSVATLSGAAITAVAAGTTTITAAFTPNDASNYESGTVTTNLTVSKGARTISFATTTLSKTYGDSNFSVSATVSQGANDGTLTYSVTGTACSVVEATGEVTILRAGSCAVSATISTGANYDQVSTTTPVTVTVSRKNLSIAGSAIASRAYSGDRTPGSLTVGTLSGLRSGESLTVTGSPAQLASANSGAYQTLVTYTLLNGSGGLASNYLLANETLTSVITKKNLTITASSASVVYGSSAPTITPTFEGFVASETSSVLDTLPTCNSLYTNTSTAGSIITTNCSGAADDNYSFTYVSGSITVTNGSRTISLSITNVNLQYGETATLTSTVSAGVGDGTITYLSTQTSICSISGNTLRAVASSGTCQIAASISAGTNFSAVTSTYTAVTLSKRTLSVSGATVANKIYDGNETATVNSALLVGVLSGDIVLLSPIALFSNKNVGTSKSVTSAMTISGSDARHYQLTQPSLGNAAITKKTITITGLTVTNRNFDSSTAAVLTGAPILNGLVPGDSVTATGATSGTFANMGPGDAITVSTAITLSGTDAGNYQITQPTLSGNISLVLANTISFTPIATKRYGVAPFTVTATASSGLTVRLTSQSSACSVSGFEVTVVSVGVCSLLAEQAGNVTYDPATPVTETFTVLAAQITLTVDNQSIVVGSATPANSYRVNGTFASGESIASVQYRYFSQTYSRSATAPTSAGTYSIAISSVTLASGNISNYQFTFVDGTYSIGSLSDKNLDGMIVFVPGNPTADFLYGAFSPTKYSYSVLLPPNASTLRVNISRSSISTFKSQVRINDSGYRTLRYSSNVGGSADSGDLPVRVGSNTILILITSLDNSTLTYTINVFRDVMIRDTVTVTSSNVESIVENRSNEVPTVASSAVTGITFSPSLTLSPTFSLTTYAYSASVPATQSSVIVTASFQGVGFVVKTRANNGGFRTVDGSGRSQPMSLVKGSNQIYVRVESRDGSVVVYSFAVTRL